MPDQDAERQKETVEKSPRWNALLPCILTTVMFGAAGASVPWMVLQPTQSAEAPKKETPVFVSFGETTVNLDDGRLSRYLLVNITLQVAEKEERNLTTLLETNRAILKSWLLSYLADKTMDDIRGAAGQNRLRREIQDHFNVTLCDDGFERIEDVLFEEFNVQ